MWRLRMVRLRMVGMNRRSVWALWSMGCRRMTGLGRSCVQQADMSLRSGRMISRCRMLRCLGSARWFQNVLLDLQRLRRLFVTAGLYLNHDMLRLARFAIGSASRNRDVRWSRSRVQYLRLLDQQGLRRFHTAEC